MRRPPFLRAPSGDHTSEPALSLPRPLFGHSPELLEQEAITWAERAGADALDGRHHAHTLAELPGRRLIEHTCALRRTDLELALQRRASDLAAELELATRRERGAAIAHDADANAVAELAGALRAAAPDRGPRLPIYLGTLGLLSVAEYPTVASALQTFPAGPTTRTILAAALSAVLALAAHCLAVTLRRRAAAQRAGRGQRREASLQLAVAVLFALALPAFVTLMAFTRGAGFADIARLTGGVFGHTQLTSGLLLALQATLFAVALAVGLGRAEGDEARRLQRALGRARRTERHAAVAHDDAAAVRTVLARRLADLPELASALREAEARLAERALALHDAHFAAAACRPQAAAAFPVLREASTA